MAFFLVCMSSLLLLIVSSYVFQLLAASRRRLPPGPMPLPVIGNLLDAASRLPHRSLARLADRYGPLMTLRLGTAVVIVASSPAAASEVLKAHNASITGRNAPDAWNAAGHAGNSVFILPPRQRWRELRRIGTEHLLSSRKLHGLRPAMSDVVQSMLRRVSEMASGGAPVDVGAAVFAAMADLQWRALFSSGLDAATLRELHGVAREAAVLALKPNVSDFFPAIAALDLQGVRRSMTRQLGKVHWLIDQEIDQRRRSREAGGVNERKSDLLDVMLDMSEECKLGAVVMNRDAMRAFLTDLFLAAIDTVSGAIEWAMAELLQNPDTMKKLKEELHSVLGSKTHVEHSDTDKLPYLQAVLKETLRLHAVVPLVPNKAEETVEIQGYTIPKGSTVIVNVWAIHHSGEAWSEPSKFMPERFLQKNVSFQGTDCEFMPFSSGRRICLGMPLAIRMLHALLGSLVHHFEWTLPQHMKENGVDMSENLGLTMCMTTPLQAVVVKGM